ncbi:aldehyde dehydrogenase family protein [Hymenobacter oligotrophus]|uniref:Aldehyde dehydrogenase family protein n=1 Tax=Hymenobacter oligotrophus TaxID=2319843 RepID=A0A3B7RR92_9BACT|nr:aldehyde dehydrogenase family protein [Hymenobacter oligotrophus]AYA36677.1 aldehyde dehydrogenase family protein [Hymenobacter oligotrophus]
MPKIISPEVAFAGLVAQVKQVAPEIFDPSGRYLNLLEGRWQEPGKPQDFVSPIDGSVLGALPMLDRDTALRAVTFANAEADKWAKTDLDERRRRVQDCLDQLRQQADLVGKLLMWEIGKTYKLGFTDIDRAIDGVQWYVDNIEDMLGNREPLGVVSNIASWNYPMSVLLHAVLVQVLCGNAAVAKTPTDGGFISLSLTFAIARRCGLPVTLVSGSGGELSDVLVKNDAIDCLSFVGGRYNGRNIADALASVHKRYMLEMEGVNTYGIWNYSDWAALEDQLKKGYDYGKQRCTAYVRFVVQRSLFPKFLETYWNATRSLKVGNPTLVDNPDDKLPDLAFGPVINRRQAEDLDRLYADALKTGATPIYEGQLDDSLFLPNQDRSAYRAPRALVNLPRQSELYFKEPFGPIDSVVLVDRVEELVGEMNISNGALVAALASDDQKWAQRTAKEIRAFKVGINKLRSRGDREEVFGGLGESWKGAFVGGKLLVEAVTQASNGQPVLGNYEEALLLPEKI